MIRNLSCLVIVLILASGLASNTHSEAENKNKEYIEIAQIEGIKEIKIIDESKILVVSKGHHIELIAEDGALYGG